MNNQGEDDNNIDFQKQSFADVFKICVLKKFVNFTGKQHLCWSLLIKMQAKGLQLY